MAYKSFCSRCDKWRYVVGRRDRFQPLFTLFYGHSGYLGRKDVQRVTEKDDRDELSCEDLLEAKK